MFRSNREMFASMTLENVGFDASQKHNSLPKTNAEQQERNTERIIRCMKKALKTSLANISMRQKQRPLNPTTDFGFKAKVAFGKDARTSSCCTSGPGSGDHDDASSDDTDDEVDDLGHFEFTDYSPMCYRHIREFFGVEWKAFQEVLVSSNWHSIPTPGKSTAQLFFCGQNWVVKTMNKEESKFLREILHRYYYHVRDNPQTLLPHFVGHHSLELSIGDSLQKISFVIMQNVFATPNKIHDKFDLKGSTVGRYADPDERKKQTCTKKDLDIDRPIRIGVQRRNLLVGQIRRDCDFLRKASIMDYSFLLGIHYLDSSRSASPPRASGKSGSPSIHPDERCFNSDQGGMMSISSPLGDKEIYYVGIIDILQQYNLWKRSETLVRGLIHDPHEISSVDPKEYSSRFLSFMSTIIV